jgi:arylsulfatase A-like enzyme
MRALAALVLGITAPDHTRVPHAALERDMFPNMIVVIGDDLGVDLLSCYGEGTLPACTPTIDSLAQRGMLFRNAWTSPLCSPTRAQLVTGRSSFRTGVGANAGRWQDSHGLPTSEVTLPEVLAGYDSAWVGKWHLAHPTAPGEGATHPNNSGFGYFAGSLLNLNNGPIGQTWDYFNWLKTVNGVETVSTTYATTDTADEAIYAAATMQEPWLLVVSFNAPHVPLQEPPANLVTCNPGTGDPDVDLKRKALEAMDRELARVLGSVDPDAYVFFIGDNGTEREAILPPFDRDHGKGTLYEGGINVPLIVAGPGVAHGECTALVSSTDLFATLAEIGRAPHAAEDSVSLVPYLRGYMTPRRATVYAERFAPNGDEQYVTRTRAIRNERFKLIESTECPDEFYDLLLDPFEQNNLYGHMTPLQLRAYDALRALLPTR